MAQVSRSYQLGWWPQRGRLDALDNAMSLPLLKLQLGPLEYAIAVPGTWFGLPPTAWIALPPFVACFASDADASTRQLWLLALCGPLLLVTLIGFFYILHKGDIMVIFKVTKYILLPSTAGPPLLAAHVLGPRAGHATALVICSWLATQSVSHVLKITARRMRPVVALADQIKSTTRRLSQLQKVVTVGETAFQSFPSGDAGGAMVYSYVLYLYGGGAWVWGLVALSAFGRVYLHAHHVFDVAAGSYLGYVCTAFVADKYGLDGGLGSFHAVGFMFVFVGLHVFCRKYMEFEIPAEFRTGQSLYGREFASPSTSPRAARTVASVGRSLPPKPKEL